MTWMEAAERSPLGIAFRKKKDGAQHAGFLVRHRDGTIWKSFWRSQMLVKVNGMRCNWRDEGWKPLGVRHDEVWDRNDDELLIDLLDQLGVDLRKNPRRKGQAMRKGFTLIELLVVIVVVAILVGLLVPAVMRAVDTANNAAISTEIQTMSQALAQFKASYGAYPPSRIVIAEDGDYSSGNLGNAAALAPRSLRYLKRFFPRVVFATNGSKPVIPGGWYDVNGNNVKDLPYIVSGHECLTLFLGGIPMATSNGYSMMGFDKNPLNPFTSAAMPPSGSSWPFGENRTVPLFDFRPGRLILAEKNGMVGYTDRYGNECFYAYFSSYEGAGYDPEDVNFIENDDDAQPAVIGIMGGFQTGNSVGGLKNTPKNDLIASPAPNPYLSDTPFPVDANGGLLLSDNRIRVYQKKDSYQIICAGKDRLFGIGGQWQEGQSEPLPFYSMGNNKLTGQMLSNGVRVRERDNLTNFSSGKLD